MEHAPVTFVTSEISSTPLSKLVHVAAGTHVGSVREENQDSFTIIEGAQFKLLVVADGMGGVQGGADASAIAIEVIKQTLLGLDHLSEPQLRDAIDKANSAIYLRGKAEPELRGMGTTLVALGISSHGILIANIGDSRAYLLRNRSIKKLTVDHTVIQDLINAGSIEERDLDHHPISHVLTRSLGPMESIEVDTVLHSTLPQPGDRFLLCSDGLYNMVSEEEIAAHLMDKSPESVVDELIDLANRRGGTDNITILVAVVPGESANGSDSHPDALNEFSMRTSSFSDSFADDSPAHSVAVTHMGVEHAAFENGVAHDKPIPLSSGWSTTWADPTTSTSSLSLQNTPRIGLSFIQRGILLMLVLVVFCLWWLDPQGRSMLQRAGLVRSSPDTLPATLEVPVGLPDLPNAKEVADLPRHLAEARLEEIQVNKATLEDQKPLNEFIAERVAKRSALESTLVSVQSSIDELFGKVETVDRNPEDDSLKLETVRNAASALDDISALLRHRELLQRSLLWVARDIGTAQALKSDPEKGRTLLVTILSAEEQGLRKALGAKSIQ